MYYAAVLVTCHPTAPDSLNLKPLWVTLPPLPPTLPSRCSGSGTEVVQRGVRVRIPAGMDGSSVLRLVGMGDAGRPGQQPGDLYLSFRVSQHHYSSGQGRAQLGD